MIKGVIFDLDGVICFTDHYHYLAWKSVADELNTPFDETVNNRLRGVSRMASLEIILERYEGKLSEEQKIEIAERKNTRYRELLQKMTPADLSADARHTLETLRKHGVPCAIGSSSRNTRLILSKLGIAELFDEISDGNIITKSKPDPEVFLKAAKMLELLPSQCLVVEDAQSGIEAAVSGGFRSAAIGDAATYGKSDFVLDKLSDILTIVLQSVVG